jgi:hypothetical protein
MTDAATAIRALSPPTNYVVVQKPDVEIVARAICEGQGWKPDDQASSQGLAAQRDLKAGEAFVQDAECAIRAMIAGRKT